MNVSEVASFGTGTIHGIIIGQVLPVKASKKRPDVKYSEVQISDGVKTMRLMSFEPILLSKVKEAQKTKQSMALQNFSFKRSCDYDNFKVHVNKKTSIVPLHDVQLYLVSSLLFHVYFFHTACT